MNNGDRREYEELKAQIDRCIDLADKAHDEGRVGDVGAHLHAALRLHFALRRLEKAIWHATVTKLRETGVVIGSGGAA